MDHIHVQFGPQSTTIWTTWDKNNSKFGPQDSQYLDFTLDQKVRLLTASQFDYILTTFGPQFGPNLTTVLTTLNNKVDHIHIQFGPHSYTI